MKTKPCIVCKQAIPEQYALSWDPADGTYICLSCDTERKAAPPRPGGKP